MTTHEFAQHLLAGPNMPIATPAVFQYSDSGILYTPYVTYDTQTEERETIAVLSYKTS